MTDNEAVQIARIEAKLEHLSPLMEIVSKIDRDLTELRAHVESDLEALQCKAGGLEVVIAGNGRDGLKTRVSNIEHSMSNLVWVLRAIVVAILGLLGNLAVSVIK